jgi:hypothetical protein
MSVIASAWLLFDERMKNYREPLRGWIERRRVRLLFPTTSRRIRGLTKGVCRDLGKSKFANVFMITARRNAS